MLPTPCYSLSTFGVVVDQSDDEDRTQEQLPIDISIAKAIVIERSGWGKKQCHCVLEPLPCVSVAWGVGR